MSLIRTTRRIGIAFLFATACAIAGCSESNGEGRGGLAGEAPGNGDGGSATPDPADGTLEEVLEALTDSDAIPFEGEALQQELDERYGPRDTDPFRIEDERLPDAYPATAG